MTELPRLISYRVHIIEL